MHEPAFWHRPRALMSDMLAPVAAIYGAISGARMQRPGTSAGIPVICVGNYHAGGAGKTPTVLALLGMLRASGEIPVVLSRGYGGQLSGPVQVDLARHTAGDVGDEPLMMAAHAPVVVARDRVAGAELAKANGASIIVMDDGFQNPSLNKDASIIVIDSVRGLGNACVFPAGPLRAPLELQLARTDALIVIGEGSAADNIAVEVEARGGLVVRARIVPEPASLVALHGQRVLAFAGIGDPERFFSTLRAHGVDVAATEIFPDHHPFTMRDIDGLAARARSQGLLLVTTEKDQTRLRGMAHLPPLATFKVGLEFGQRERLVQFVASRLAKART
ncbi:MAG: tetraacyldisaccharide 4'-kinase [Proteobacteria bacterium SG_bin9]|nr:MAG: tetraacyldisaccharide 4'-kinase [Proteobacteria bacterium SG_bin9]